jgi:hypothetical protein
MIIQMIFKNNRMYDYILEFMDKTWKTSLKFNSYEFYQPEVFI